MIFLIFFAIQFIEIQTIISNQFRLLANVNLSIQYDSMNLIQASSVPSYNGKIGSEPKRSCLKQCNQLFSCLVAYFNSNDLTCAMYSSGPKSEELISLSSNFIYIFYKQRAQDLCTLEQYHDTYSCGNYLFIYNIKFN